MLPDLIEVSPPSRQKDSKVVLPGSKSLTNRALILAALAGDVQAIESRAGIGASAYDEWIAAGLNNAHLASVATYYDCVPGFERLLTEAGGSMPAFYARVREVAALGYAERHARLCTPLNAKE